MTRRLIAVLPFLALSACGFGSHGALWTTRTDARLNARFVVAGDAIVIPDHSVDGDDVLSAFGIADGAPRWQTPLEYFDSDSGLSGIIVGADPGGAFVYLAQGTMVARFAAADGAQQWAVQVPPEEPFESFTVGDWPVVVGERLYLLSRHSRLVAVDRRDGRLVFRTDDSEMATDLAVRGDVVITRSYEVNDVRAHDAETGVPRWRHALAAPSPITSRLETSIRLAPDDGRYLVVDGERTLLSLDARTGAVRWQEPVVGLASYAFAGPVVVVTDSASVRGIDAATGAVRWRHPTGGLSLVAPLDERTALLVLSRTICTIDAAGGAIRKHARHRTLHEQDGVLDARGGLVVVTTDNGVARLCRLQGDRLVERPISSGVSNVWRQHSLEQAAIASGSAFTFNTGHTLQRFAR